MKINFDSLSIGALRKYQYRFRIAMAPDDKPLITRAELLAAINHHFYNEFPELSESAIIAKFLKLKKEERAENQGIHYLRKQTRPTGRGGPSNRNKPAVNSLGMDQ